MSAISSSDRVGDFRLGRVIARGHAAWIDEATDEATGARDGRPVWLKRMAPTSAFRGARAQFLREADVLERVRQPGVARVHGRGTLADGHAWFAIDRPIGPSLADVITSGARVDALRVIVELATILERAHERGVAHRHLRAEAIGCGVEARGPALRVDDWTQSRELAVAPADATADVHALGVIAFQCLSGVMAFGASGLAAQGAPAAVRFPRASRLLTALVDRMLARDVRVRPAIGELREAAGALAGLHAGPELEMRGEATRIDGWGSAPAGGAAEGRRGSIDGWGSAPAGSAAEGRRGSIDGGGSAPAGSAGEGRRGWIARAAIG